MPKPRILLAPLCWGLGHATRCLPIAEALTAAGAEVVLASDGAALDLLRAAFGERYEFWELPAYDISYKHSNMIWSMAGQLPHILRTMRKEGRVLAGWIQNRGIDGFISDNRYGLFSPLVPSVFVTHQLHLRIPFFPLQWAMRRLNYRLIRKYTHCWVPDMPPPLPALSGELARPANLTNIEYIGELSRLQRIESSERTPIDVLILLSGVEPARANLEAELLRQAAKLPNWHFRLVRGVLSANRQTPQWQKTSANIDSIDYLGAEELAQQLAQAGRIVCRSGYSTLMDLRRVGTVAPILIPTKGQTEQEHLGEDWARKGWAVCKREENLDLAAALAAVEKLPPLPLSDSDSGLLQRSVERFLRPFGAKMREG